MIFEHAEFSRIRLRSARRLFSASGNASRRCLKGRNKRPASSVSPFQGWHVPGPAYPGRRSRVHPLHSAPGWHVPPRWGKEPPGERSFRMNHTSHQSAWTGVKLNPFISMVYVRFTQELAQGTATAYSQSSCSQRSEVVMQFLEIPPCGQIDCKWRVRESPRVCTATGFTSVPASPAEKGVRHP
jgi:hypothetical protein